MRWDISRHTYGDTRGAVHQKIREAAGEHGRLLQGFVVVFHIINRIFFQIGQHFHGKLGHTRLGITHSRRAVAVDRTEVTLTVYQRIADIEILRQAHHRIINGWVAVRMVFRQHVTDDMGRFFMCFIWKHTRFVHRKQNTAMDRLQTVAHIGQRAAGDDAHRIINKRILNFFFHDNGHDFAVCKIIHISSFLND